MADAKTDKARPTPPYIPYKTLVNSLDVFETHGLPPQIDRGIWKTQPGGVQGLLLASYKFLGLVDDSGRPQELLATLVTDKEHRSARVEKLLRSAYPEILGKHDLAKMTAKMLEDEFETAYGVQGDTKRKGITFLLQAAKAAQMPLSGFLESQVRVVRRTKRNGSKRDSGGERQNDPPPPADVLDSTRVMPIPLGPGRIARLEMPADWVAERDLARLLKMLKLSLSEGDVEV
jgi:hypothetical protein